MQSEYARRLRAGTLSDDDFDQLLPLRARIGSAEYWTPIPVAQLAARRFAEQGTSRVLDVGCGIGKFCLAAAALHGDIEWFGIDRRHGLVHDALAMGGPFGLDNVSFAHGDALERSWDEFDGFYFFNPFYENLAPEHERFDLSVQLSRARFVEEIERIETRLRALRAGTVVITYHGLGGPIPSSFALVADEVAGNGRLRTWRKTEASDAPWVHLETDEGVCCAIHE
jgi:SAM-dependent methyltransferase